MVIEELSINQVAHLNSRARRTLSASLISAILLHSFVFAVYLKAEFLPSGAERLSMESQVIKMSFAQSSLKQINVSQPKAINNKPEPEMESAPKVITKPKPTLNNVDTRSSPIAKQSDPMQEKARTESIAQVKNYIAVKDKQVDTQNVVDNYQPPSSNISYHNNPDPYYPRAAIRRGMEGTVELTVRVDAAGVPVNIEIRQSSGYNILDKEAVIAVWKWRFKPAYRGAMAVPGDAIVPIHYQLEEG